MCHGGELHVRVGGKRFAGREGRSGPISKPPAPGMAAVTVAPDEPTGGGWGGGGSGAPQRIYLKTLSVSRQNDDQEPLIVLRYMSWGYCFKLFFVRAALTGPQTETFKGSVTGATFPDPPLRGVMGLKRPSPPPPAQTFLPYRMQEGTRL